MLVILNRYKLLFAIVFMLILAAVIWFMISARSSRIPSNGVFVMKMAEGGDSPCSRL
ncbi:MAG: hypothetical protein GX477_08715 [Clostridiaceae bacterium]|jgi:uncharacterized membrane protein YqiK|nr:hypothetical protein [Clostridiaceae bacterium]